MTTNQHMSFGDFLVHALLWSGVGCVTGSRGSELARWAILGPISEQTLGYTLEDIGAALERERRKKELQERIADITKNLLAPNSQFPEIKIPEQPLSTLLPIQTPADSRWRAVITHPSIVVVLGGRGSGKTAVSYRVMEDFRYSLSPYVVGFPEHNKGLLPDWIGIEKSLENVPPKSISIVDEAYLSHHAREWQKTGNRDVCRLLNLSRQQDKTIVFIAQLGRQLDIDIVSSADVLILKNPGMLQPRFDRPEFRDILMEAKQAFQSVKDDIRRWSYVYSQNAGFSGLLENELPTFWSPKLSNVYATMGGISPPKPRVKMTLEEKILKAKELNQAGWSQGRLADCFRVSKSTIFNWIHDYPYKGE